MTSPTAVRRAVLAPGWILGLGFLAGCDSSGEAPAAAAVPPPAAEQAAPRPTAPLLPPPGSPAEPVPRPGSSRLVFTEEAAARGITASNHCGDPVKKRYALEEIGNGCALLDANGDGALDVYLVDACTLRPPEEDSGIWTPAMDGACKLYLGDGTGRFTDGTDASGLAFGGFGVGASVADYDNDGDPDLFMTCWGPNRLYQNQGDGTFLEVAAAAGIGGSSWSVGSCWLDADGDSDLDLYVANYFTMDVARDPDCWRKVDCPYRDLLAACGPKGMVADPDQFFLNRGDGTFEDVSESCGIRDPEPRYGLGAIAFDFDGDGDQDVYVANDSRGNFLFQNDGHARFEQVGDIMGAALNRDGVPQAGMGIACGDLDEDLDLDLFLTNFSHDYNTFYRNDEGFEFLDITRTMGFGEDEFFALGWGTVFADLDNDTDLDLYVANGHVYPEADQRAPELTYRQRNHLYRNDGGQLGDVSREGGPGLERVSSSRGVAAGDLDNDGDLDLVVVEMNEVPSLLVNAGSPGRSLLVSLVGTACNRDAVGARAIAHRGGRKLLRLRASGQSFASDHDPRLHFGLGDAETLEVLEVLWPDGSTSRWKELPGNAWVRLRQGDLECEVVRRW